MKKFRCRSGWDLLEWARLFQFDCSRIGAYREQPVEYSKIDERTLWAWSANNEVIAWNRMCKKSKP